MDARMIGSGERARWRILCGTNDERIGKENVEIMIMRLWNLR